MSLYWFIKKDGKMEKLSREEALRKMNDRLFDLGEGGALSESFHDCLELQAVNHSKQSFRKIRFDLEKAEKQTKKDIALIQKLEDLERKCDEVYEMIQIKHLGEKFQRPGDTIQCRADGSRILVE